MRFSLLFPLTVILLLSGCIKGSIFEDHLDLSDLNKIQMISETVSVIEKQSNQFQGKSPFQFPVDKDFLRTWLDDLQAFRQIKSSGFSINGIRPVTITLECDQIYYRIESYKKENEVYVLVKGRIKKDNYNKSFYINAQDYSKVFVNLMTLRESIPRLDFSQKLFYNVNNRKVEIKSNQKNTVEKIFHKMTFSTYSEYKEIDQSVFNRYKLGLYHNDKIQGEFELGGKKLKVGRDSLSEKRVILWHENWNYISNFGFNDWKQLKDWEKEFIK